MRHVERTRLLLHFLDVSGIEGRDPIEDFYAINEELKKYSEKLCYKKTNNCCKQNRYQCKMINLLKQVEELAKKEGLELYKISAATKEGVEELIDHVDRSIKNTTKRRNYSKSKTKKYIH